MANKFIGYAGTYTRESSEGIYRFVLDADAGNLESVAVAAKVGSPTYLAISEDRRHLYSVDQQDKLGGVASYEIDKESGELRFLQRTIDRGCATMSS